MLVGLEHPEEEGHKGQDEEQAVDTVEDTTMPRDDVPGVLDTDAALDHRLEEVSPRSDYGDEYPVVGEFPPEDQPGCYGRGDESTDEAFPALLRRDGGEELVLAQRRSS